MEHARRAFLRDYRVPHGPARTRTKNAIIAFACAPHRVFCKNVAITRSRPRSLVRFRTVNVRYIFETGLCPGRKELHIGAEEAGRGR